MAAKVVVIGVGMVGEQIVSILKEHSLPIDWPPKVCATRERTEILAGETFEVEKVSEDSFKDADVVLLAGKEGAKGASVTWRATIEASGAIAIDNSKDFRHQDNDHDRPCSSVRRSRREHERRDGARAICRRGARDPRRVSGHRRHR